MSKRVVLREDDEDLALLVQEILEDAGFAVIRVIEIEDLMRVAKQHSPCVALIDGTAPSKYDLWWLGPELRRLGVPAVAFTAHASAEAEFATDSHGFAGIISKPFDADEFVEIINNICWDDHHAVAS
jgi:DNA-binding NtrC family response regulator